MDRDLELQWLYREIAQMLVKAGAVPGSFFKIKPVDMIGNWARAHPNEAYQLAIAIRNKITQALP